MTAGSTSRSETPWDRTNHIRVSASSDTSRAWHVTRSSDPFKLGTDRQRPWLVVNNASHPFDDEQFVAVAISGRLPGSTSESP